jgi:hypothetical protein
MLTTPPSAAGSFATARRIFAAALGLIFLAAFASLGVQVRGLMGSHGIAPAESFLKAAHTALGASAYYEVPTLAWLGSGDGMLVATCAAGGVLGIVLAAGCCPGACALACWALYLSMCSIGGPFLNFQWDALLLETGLLAALWLPWRWRPDWSRAETPLQRTGRWLVWWLVFRLMFESGLVKLTWEDPTWRELRALDFHFATQPLPLWTAWYMHQLPRWILRAMTFLMFVIEIAAPFLIIAPRRWRHGAGLALIGLQVFILATGNYAFFNWLTIALCLPLFDDAFWPQKWRVRCASSAGNAPRAWPIPWIIAAPIAAIAGALVLVATLPSLIGSFYKDTPEWLATVSARTRCFQYTRSFNGYGLFRVMTTERPEIVVEGSRDGAIWSAYEFRWKPNGPRDRPLLVAPHQPRLDWQMWFAALGDARHNPWFMNFLVRLLEGSPEVLDLLAKNPFPEQPPRYVRAVLYDYQFTAWSDDTAAWWRREQKGLYCPPISLRPRDEKLHEN